MNQMAGLMLLLLSEVLQQPQAHRHGVPGDAGSRSAGRVSFMSLPLPTTDQASPESKGLGPKACP